MSSPMAAPGAATPQDAAASLAALLSPARAAASRRNGRKGREGVGAPLPNGPLRKSRGPRTPEGKTRSAQNALKHGLRAQKFVVVGEGDLGLALIRDGNGRQGVLGKGAPTPFQP